jgi:hypothetical protein
VVVGWAREPARAERRPNLRHVVRSGADVFELRLAAAREATGVWLAFGEDHVAYEPGWFAAVRAAAEVASTAGPDGFVGATENGAPGGTASA